MENGLSELVFIFDRSASMAGLEVETIRGFNELLRNQKMISDEAYVTTVLFDDRYELIHDRIRIAGVKPLNESQYYVRGCTALLDAIGITINKIVNTQRNTIALYRPEKVIFVIITDGYENCSKSFTFSKLRQMIKHQRDQYGWEFLFFGANMDAIYEASKIGIYQDRAVSYNNDMIGVALNYEVASDTIKLMRTQRKRVGNEWKTRIEQDFQSRKIL